MWLVALVTALVSFVAMYIFNWLLSVVYYFLGKVPFLTDILDYLGELLEIGLTALAAYLIAIAIWKFGHSVIEKINGGPIEFEDSPIRSVNFFFLIPFLAILVFFGYQFVVLIGGTVAAYTAEFEGFTKILLFFKAIKDTLVFVCNEHIILYRVGVSSFYISIINLFADQFD